MPRKPRFDLPGYPQHVIQRGNNREACFFDAADFRFYLVSLGKALGLDTAPNFNARYTPTC